MSKSKEIDMTEIKSMKEWESDLQLFFIDYTHNKNITREEALSAESLSVDHEFRKQWLIKNDYELTRENFMNVSLKPITEKEGK